MDKLDFWYFVFFFNLQLFCVSELEFTNRFLFLPDCENQYIFLKVDVLCILRFSVYHACKEWLL